MSLAWLSVPEWQALLARGGLRGRRASTAGSTASPWRGGEDSIWVCRPTAAAVGRSACRATRRARSRRRRRRSATRRPRSGSTPRRRARPRPAAPPAPRRAGTRRARRDRRAPSGDAARAPRARPLPVVSSHEPRAGTRQIEPALARSAFGEVGSAQPSESATAAPKASAVRISVPTLPGSARRQSASVAWRSSHAGQVGAAVDGDHPRRMRRARDVGEQLRLDVLARRAAGRPARGGRRDRVLALDEEEPELVAPAPVVQLADELQALVVLARDHASAPVQPLAVEVEDTEALAAAAGVALDVEREAVVVGRAAGADEDERLVARGLAAARRAPDPARRARGTSSTPSGRRRAARLRAGRASSAGSDST